MLAVTDYFYFLLILARCGIMVGTLKHHCYANFQVAIFGLQELLEKCHPLGLFDSIATLAVATSMRELYRLVLIDTPLAPYFSVNLTSEDLDEMNVEIMRNTLYKAYLDDFAEMCKDFGGGTSEVMGDMLAFEVIWFILGYASHRAVSCMAVHGAFKSGMENRMHGCNVALLHGCTAQPRFMYVNMFAKVDRF